MTWFKLDDQFPDHPKVVAAGGDAAWLHVCGCCYAAKHETNGKVPKNIVPRLSDRKNPMKLAGALVDAGLWHDLGDEYEIHDFLEYNPSKAELDSKRKAKAMAGAMGAAKRWGSQLPSQSHSSSHPGPNAPDPLTNTVKPPAEPFVSEFEAWWVDYPRKVSKADAFKAYQARRRQGIRHHPLMVAAQQYAKTKAGTELRYLLHGATFLAKDGPWSEWVNGPPEGELPVPAFAPALKGDSKEPRRCPTCSNTGRYFDDSGEFVACDHAALKVAG